MHILREETLLVIIKVQLNRDYFIHASCVDDYFGKKPYLRHQKVPTSS